MIKNHQMVAGHIVTWMSDYQAKAGAAAWVGGLSGGIDSALVALLAKQTGIPSLWANLPCHSSPSAFDRANAFAEEQGIKMIKIDLVDAHASVMRQFNDQVGRHNLATKDTNDRAVAGALRSCLRAPPLSLMAHALNGIILGTGNRSEDHITRYYQKFGDGCVDIAPIADLWKSEVNSLFHHLTTDGGKKSMGPAATAIYRAKPSADLWGADAGQEDEKELGLTYDEIEWADKEDVKTNMIFHDNHPEKHEQWGSYSERERHVLKTLHRMEKVSRHKHNPNMPVCQVHTGLLLGLGYVDV
jgi:NAD+ synthase